MWMMTYLMLQWKSISQVLDLISISFAVALGKPYSLSRPAAIKPICWAALVIVPQKFHVGSSGCIRVGRGHAHSIRIAWIVNKECICRTR